MPINFADEFKNTETPAPRNFGEIIKPPESGRTGAEVPTDKYGINDSITQGIMDKPLLSENLQATYRGLLSFGATIANIATKPFPKANQAVQEHVKSQESIYQRNVQEHPSLAVNKLIGELAGTAPLGPAFGALGKLPGMVGSALPRGLQTLGRYGTAAATGTAGGAMFNATQYDPNNPQLLNMDAARKGLSNPLPAMMGMGGTFANRYLQQTQNLGQAQDQSFGAIVLNRDVGKASTKQVADTVFQSMPIIGDAGRRAAQNTSFIDATNKMIKSISIDVAEKTAGMSGTRALDFAAKKAINTAHNRITTVELQKWDPINKVANKIQIGGIKTQAIKSDAQKLLETYGPEIQNDNPGLYTAINRLFVKSEKAAPTFKDLQNSKSMISSYFYNPKKDLSRPAASEVSNFIKGLYNNLDDSIQKVDPSLVKIYHEANAFTAEKHKMFLNAGPTFNKAVADNANAYSFVKKLITEDSPTRIEQRLSLFNRDEASILRAGILSKHLKTSIDETSGKFNLSKFLDLTSQEKNIKELMGPTYQSLKGLQDIMRPAQVAEDLTRQGGMSGGMSGNLVRSMQVALPTAAAVGAVTAPQTTATIIASAAAAAKISQYSPIKSMLIAASRASGNPRILEYMKNQIYRKMQQAGLVINYNKNIVNIDRKEEDQ